MVHWSFTSVDYSWLFLPHKPCHNICWAWHFMDHCDTSCEVKSSTKLAFSKIMLKSILLEKTSFWNNRSNQISHHNEIVIALQQLHSKYHLQRLDQSSQLLLEALPSCNVSVTLSHSMCCHCFYLNTVDFPFTFKFKEIWMRFL